MIIRICTFIRSWHAVALPYDECKQYEYQASIGLAITFLIIGLIAAVLAFAGIADTAAGIAKILFLILLVLFVISLNYGRRRATLQTGKSNRKGGDFNELGPNTRQLEAA